ncbi:MAG: TniB family NTP-binding protein [Phycisphaerales bacterium]|nr:TniB family NTP-binding protein [Phycisphaerales bacterium]
MTTTQRQDLPHLSPLANDAVHLTDADRLQFIQADRWIGFTQAERALDLLHDLMHHHPCARMPCLLIYGDSGMGKTKIIERFRRCFLAKFDTETGVEHHPIIVMEMPPGPEERRFYAQLLDTLNAPSYGQERLDVLERTALRLLKIIKPRLLAIDEVHNLLSGTARQQRRSLNLLKFIANSLRIPIVCLGTQDALHTMQSDAQISSRFEPLHLPRWQADASFRQLLATLETILPLRKPSNLVRKAFVKRIHTQTDGITGNVVRLLSRAAIHAILAGEEAINDEMLTAAQYPPQLQRDSAEVLASL